MANHRNRLREIEGDWHEFESKALRREKERQEKEARRAAKETAAAARGGDRDKKRPPESGELVRDAKRTNVDARARASAAIAASDDADAPPTSNVDVANP